VNIQVKGYGEYDLKCRIKSRTCFITHKICFKQCPEFWSNTYN